MTRQGARLVASFQKRLEALYAVVTPHRVERFLIERAAGEMLLVHESQPEESLELGLVLAPRLIRSLRSLERLGAAGVMERLPAIAEVTEGVSHFLYLVLRVERQGRVTSLELEVQAEVDKYAIALMLLRERGGESRRGELRDRLFLRIGFREGLSEEEHHRYREANRLALRYVRYLERRFIEPGATEGLLRELRTSYRRGASDKLEYFEGCGS